MSKPASDNTIKQLATNMGCVINDCFPKLINCINGLSKLEEIHQSDGVENNNYYDYKNVLEMHSSVLYTIIEVACSFRADFYSNITIEKRVNLKYIVYITSEFFKSYLNLNKKNESLWNSVSEHISALNIVSINSDITKVNENISRYKKLYYDKDKGNRDITVHYDFDLCKLYDYLVNISEGNEAQRLCDFMAIVQPLHNILSFYSSVIVKQVQVENISTLSDSLFDKTLSDNLREKLYPLLGDSLQHFAYCLDKNMHTYSIVEKLPDNIKKTLGNSGLERIIAIRDYTKTAILLHYIYIDLGTTIRGYLQSETYIEKRWILIRINVIIYEGWKKIYKQQPNGDKSLWEQFIYAPLILIEDEAIKEEITTVNFLLDAYKENKQMEEIRHKYIHLREHKKNNLPDLFNEILKLNSYKELNKSLDFLKLLSRIIKLNIKSMQIAVEEENNINRKKLQHPFNLIKSKILESNMPEDKKTELLNTIEDGESKIMSIFE